MILVVRKKIPTGLEGVIQTVSERSDISESTKAELINHLRTAMIEFDNTGIDDLSRFLNTMAALDGYSMVLWSDPSIDAATIDELDGLVATIRSSLTCLLYKTGGSDHDNDGIENTMDNCPLINNSDQSDIDGDGVGDSCDYEDDNDLVGDAIDNCPVDDNMDQFDADFDGRGDVCVPDDDNDSVLDLNDICPNTDSAPTNDEGCNADQLIELLCPAGGEYKNHGKSVSCVAKATELAVEQGLMSGKKRDKRLLTSYPSFFGGPSEARTRDQLAKKRILVSGPGRVSADTGCLLDLSSLPVLRSRLI